jgi:hypothetical protein
MRTCARCGRRGYNAFEPIGEGPDWACSHDEPCRGRRREVWRAGTRAAVGRPRSSPITPWVGEDEKACVIGSDDESTAVLERIVRDLTPLEVERLGCSAQAMARLSHTDYRLVVLDARPGDPLAFCNEVYRRLSRPERLGIPVLITADSPAELRGPLAQLAARARTHLLPRPATHAGLDEAITHAMGWDDASSDRTA